MPVGLFAGGWKFGAWWCWRCLAVPGGAWQCLAVPGGAWWCVVVRVMVRGGAGGAGEAGEASGAQGALPQPAHELTPGALTDWLTKLMG